MLDQQLLDQIKEQGINATTVEQQIKNFQQGFPFLNIIKAASVESGILRLNQDQIEQYRKTYQKESQKKKIVKFVPASGAASRMFKDLFAFVDSGEQNSSVEKFFKGLKGFAFYETLRDSLAGKAVDIESAAARDVVSALLLEDGLDYGSLPKGLLLFHLYNTIARTPVEEHLVEGAGYAVGEGGEINIHFTVSPSHEEKFEAHVSAIKKKYETELGVKFNIEFSNQKNATDTIAVDMNNDPFHEDNGTVLFRPAGHGALLDNLNDIDADIVFIKNIDNVVPDRLKEETTIYKQVLGGVLLGLQNRVFDYLKRLEVAMDSQLLAEVAGFVENELFVQMPNAYQGMSSEEKVEYLKTKLDRPIRVCGMVRNEGAAGGGPFWVKNDDGSASLQILETAQINLDDPSQSEILEGSSHFNPVDLLCGVKSMGGKKYDLIEYRDPQTGFISYKSKNGRELKAQELPGLWNGAMSDWNTVFVEVPISTFNPVKSVIDLLKPEHQG